MSWALFRKALFDSRVMLILAVLGVLLFEMLWVVAMKNVAPMLIEMWRQLEFLHKLFKVLLSVDLVEGEVSISSLLAMGLVHPVLLVITWGTLITHCTRVTSGEIDKGTADLLLTLPVTRATVFISTTLVWIAAAAAFSGLALAGLLLGSVFAGLEDPLEVGRLALVVINLFAMYLAIGGTAMCVASYHNRRPPAVGVVLGILVVSFLINFLEALIPDVMRYFTWLGFLSYYRPVEIVNTGTMQWLDVAVLSIVGAVTWGIGLRQWQTKDVPA